MLLSTADETISKTRLNFSLNGFYETVIMIMLNFSVDCAVIRYSLSIYSVIYMCFVSAKSNYLIKMFANNI